jgi:hypothetical protein
MAGVEGGNAVEGVRGRAAAAAAVSSSALSDPNHPQHRSDAYQRLRELVYASEHIDPDYVLSKLGQVRSYRALSWCWCRCCCEQSGLAHVLSQQAQGRLQGAARWLAAASCCRYRSCCC